MSKIRVWRTVLYYKDYNYPEDYIGMPLEQAIEYEKTRDNLANGEIPDEVDYIKTEVEVIDDGNL